MCCPSLIDESSLIKYHLRLPRYRNKTLESEILENIKYKYLYHRSDNNHCYNYYNNDNFLEEIWSHFGSTSLTLLRKHFIILKNFPFLFVC